MHSKILSYYFGLIAEWLVIILYKIRFYKILGHRVRSKVGEIDLVFTKGRELVFVEVKARSAKTIDHRETLTLGQQKRITKAAEFFVFKNKQYANYDIRFDFVLVQKFAKVTFVKNAW